MHQTDVAIIGGGIVGLATSYRLRQRYPGTKVTVLEKEAELAQHQTGHNSGVLHSGIYYKPGTLRATNCRAGKAALERFCDEHEIPYDLCGKVVVATNEVERSALQKIYDRGQANGVSCEMIDRERLAEIEPHAAGVAAIHVPETGIIDFKQVCAKLAELLLADRGNILLNAEVTDIRVKSDHVVVHSNAGDVEAKYLVTCAGLYSDRVTKLTGQDPGVKIVPFRGEYYELKPEVNHLCRGLIYPVPDPKFPFLGVHFTRMIAGGVECGPNAVLAFAREGYHKTDVNPIDLLDALSYPGFLRMGWRHWPMGIGEMWRSVSKASFVKSLQRLLPEVRSEHLVASPAGVRANALGRDGSLVDDFLFVEQDRVVNVCNAPSPAATASLNIGELIVDKLAAHMR